MGLRFFSVTGRGWVRRNADLIFESAHPLEKSAPGFVDTNSLLSTEPPGRDVVRKFTHRALHCRSLRRLVSCVGGVGHINLTS
jgi:hypothetical protein